MKGKKELHKIELSMPYVPKIWKSIIKPIRKLTYGKKSENKHIEINMILKVHIKATQVNFANQKYQH